MEGQSYAMKKINIKVKRDIKKEQDSKKEEAQRGTLQPIDSRNQDRERLP